MRNKEIIFRREDCRACKSKNLDLFFALKPSPIGDAFINKNQLDIKQEKFPIDLFMCKDCGLAQLLDVIDPDILYGNYIYLTESSVGLKNHFKNFASHIMQILKLKENSVVIDLGSNDGILLNFFKNFGMNVIGIEPAKEIAQAANKNGIKTIPKYFSSEVVDNILQNEGKAKLITSNNVFANVDDIRSWVKCVENLLDFDGVYVFESFYLLDVINNFVFDFIYHEHLSAFSVKPIKKLFESVGLNLIKVEHVETKGGSLRYFVQREQGPLSDDGSVADYLALEEKEGLYVKQTYQEFAERVKIIKFESIKKLKELKDEGKVIAGFGASITGTTLIHHFELEELLDYLIDDNRDKQGKYSPGIHLPVYPVEHIYQKKPDYVYILAWRFASYFIDKNEKFINSGGKVIIPVPNLKVIET